MRESTIIYSIFANILNVYALASSIAKFINKICTLKTLLAYLLAI